MIIWTLSVVFFPGTLFALSQKNAFHSFAFQILLHFDRGIIIDPGQQRAKLRSRAHGEGEF